MISLALKLILTPLLIGAATVAGRRWGPAVSGWLVGLPFTSGPVAFFLALDHSPRFAATAAAGILAGTISQTGFCLTYGWLGRRHSWLLALIAGSVAFAGMTVALRIVSPPLWLVVAAVLASLLIGLALMPPVAEMIGDVSPPPRWDLPARMIVTTALVLLLTGLAPLLGARLTGLITPFPLYAATLASFAHAQRGSDAAIAVLRGLLFGLFAFTGFFLALAVLLAPFGIGPAFLIAMAAVTGLQAVSFHALRQT